MGGGNTTRSQSAIFPCPPEPESVVVSPSKTYWHRFTDEQGMEIVRLMRDPVESTDPETGDTLYEYDELEVRLAAGELATLAEHFDEMWLEHEPKGEPAVNPIQR